MLSKKARVSAALLGKVRPYDSIRGKYFVIKIFESPAPFRRYCVVVSKNIAKKATQRNALRRVMYEWVRTHEPLKEEKNILILALPALANLPQEEIKNQLTETFHRISKQ